MSKFDAARANGEMKPTATLGMGTTDGKNYISIVKRAICINMTGMMSVVRTNIPMIIDYHFLVCKFN